MKKQLLTLIAFAGSALASQSSVLVKVPFAFTAGLTTLPAGTYTIQETGTHCILIHGAGGSTFVLDKGASLSLDHAGKVAVRFGHKDAGYVLESIQPSGSPNLPR